MRLFSKVPGLAARGSAAMAAPVPVTVQARARWFAGPDRRVRVVAPSRLMGTSAVSPAARGRLRVTVTVAASVRPSVTVPPPVSDTVVGSSSTTVTAMSGPVVTPP